MTQSHRDHLYGHAVVMTSTRVRPTQSSLQFALEGMAISRSVADRSRRPDQDSRWDAHVTQESLTQDPKAQGQQEINHAVPSTVSLAITFT